jgi:hypothetical protein
VKGERGICGLPLRHRFAIIRGMTWQEFVAIALLGVLAAVVIFILYNGITL